MLVSWGAPTAKPEDLMSNTLFFNVSGSVDDPNYQSLADDLAAIYAGVTWCSGMKIEVRAYNMSDAKPRPEKAYKTVTAAGTRKTGAHQVAVALSYYADRNLPRRRGRIFTGPWSANNDLVDSSAMGYLIAFGQALAGLGGLNVDWSVHSVMDNAYYRISNIWVDDSWDVIRSRKVAATTRQTATING